MCADVLKYLYTVVLLLLYLKSTGLFADKSSQMQTSAGRVLCLERTSLCFENTVTNHYLILIKKTFKIRLGKCRIRFNLRLVTEKKDIVV